TGAVGFWLRAMSRYFQTPVSSPVIKNKKAAVRQYFSASVIIRSNLGKVVNLSIIKKCNSYGQLFRCELAFLLLTFYCVRAARHRCTGRWSLAGRVPCYRLESPYAPGVIQPVCVGVVSHPDGLDRRLFPGQGVWPLRQQPSAAAAKSADGGWCARHRSAGQFLGGPAGFHGGGVHRLRRGRGSGQPGSGEPPVSGTAGAVRPALSDESGVVALDRIQPGHGLLYLHFRGGGATGRCIRTAGPKRCFGSGFRKQPMKTVGR